MYYRKKKEVDSRNEGKKQCLAHRFAMDAYAIEACEVTQTMVAQDIELNRAESQSKRAYSVAHRECLNWWRPSMRLIHKRA